jgi:hypothetical protein
MGFNSAFKGLIFDAKALTIIMFAFSLRVEVNVQITMPGQQPTHSKQVSKYT